MVSLETESDRTLFFDLLPIEVGTIGGFKTRLQLYTVPGQVFYNTTRKLVLKGVDGLVFVADSQRPMREANIESFTSLKQNLAELGLDFDELPVVLQYNKRDLKSILSVDELNADLNPDQAFPCFESSAINGTGVFETLKEITKLTLKKLRKRMAAPEAASRPKPTTAVRPTTPTAPRQPTAISAAALARAAEEGVEDAGPAAPPPPPSEAAAAVEPTTPPDESTVVAPEAAAEGPTADEAIPFANDGLMEPPVYPGRPGPPPSAPAENGVEPATESALEPQLEVEEPPPGAAAPGAVDAADAFELEDPAEAEGPAMELEPPGDEPIELEYDAEPDADVAAAAESAVTFEPAMAFEPMEAPVPEHEAAEPSEAAAADEETELSEAAPADEGADATEDAEPTESEVEVDFEKTEIDVTPPPLKRVHVSNQMDILAELDTLRKAATMSSETRRQRSAAPSLDLDTLLGGSPERSREMKRRIAKQLNNDIFEHMHALQLAVRIQDREGETIHTLDPVSLHVNDASSADKVSLQFTIELENKS
jgi:signal recognition particle receptor subunit beta